MTTECRDYKSQGGEDISLERMPTGIGIEIDPGEGWTRIVNIVVSLKQAKEIGKQLIAWAGAENEVR